MTSGFTLNVKAFREKTSPFTLNGEGISENNVIKLRKITANTSKTNANKAAVLRKNPYFLI